MRELRVGKIDEKIYLFPVPVIKQRKYLIFCSSEVEAQFLIAGITSKKISHPDLLSEDFIFLSFHADKMTKIFVPNPNILLKS